MREQLKLLIVDDSAEDRELYKRLLAKSFADDIQIIEANCGEDGLEICRKMHPNCVLLDYSLPDIDGLTFLGEISKDTALAKIPVVMLTGSGNESIAVRALKNGAYDYIVKADINADDLYHTICNTLEKWRSTNNAKAQTEKVTHLAYHDYLTGLPNRLSFDKELNRSLQHSRDNNHFAAVMLLDLDNFKEANDTKGHLVGDQILQEVAKRFTLCIRKADFLARLGGDEFAIILTEVREPKDASAIAQRVLNAVNQPINIGGSSMHISVSIGIATYPISGEDGPSIVDNADKALYRVKANGGNSYEFFTQEIQTQNIESIMIENGLRFALLRNEFFLVYQPIMDLTSNHIIGVEALLRWQHPDLGVVMPDKFISVAEENRLILPIGDWVLSQACRQLKLWNNSGFQNLRLAVNLSGLQLMHRDFLEIIKATITETQINPRYLELEITESTIIDQHDVARPLLEQLHKLGIHILIDDFGSGYSTFTRLKDLPVTGLKISREFIMNINKEPKNIEIVKSMIELAKRLDMLIVAEGIETEAEHKTLTSLNCELAQGFFYSEPLGVRSMTKLLQESLRQVSMSLSALAKEIKFD